MTRRKRTSAAGIDLIKGFEGFRAQAVKLSSGRFLIGYGHMDSARKGLEISAGDAELLLKEYDLRPVEETLTQSVLTPLDQNEFDALASFVFNIGLDGFESSEVLALLNSGQKTAAAGAMALWRQARMGKKLITLDALVRRRSAEIALFLAHPSGPVPAPSALFRPRLDAGDVSQGTHTLQNGQADEPELVIQPVSFQEAAGPVIIEETVKPDTTENAQSEIATELAAKQVKERLSRILDEAPKGVVEARIEENRKEPSIEEITAAVSALADPTPERAAEKKQPSQKPDLPRPAALRQATTADPKPHPKPAPNGAHRSVDLEGAETVMRQIETELANGRTPAGVRIDGFETKKSASRWFWPGVTVFGTLLMIWGMVDRFALFPLNLTMTGTDFDPVPPLLVLAGLILIGLGIWNVISGTLRQDD